LKKSTNKLQLILLDTNVVIDMLLKREPFANDAREIFRLVESGDIRASVCATTVTTVDYLVTKFVGGTQSRKLLVFLASLCDVAEVNKRVLLAALAAPMSDFEDAVIAESAKASGITSIITRNGKDFVGCGCNVYSPGEWLAAR
jgi:predicted nucleic acid-binding protein